MAPHPEQQVNFLLVPDMVQLDLTGPYEILARVPHWQMNLVAADLEPVRTDHGLVVLPTHSRENAPPPDILVIPGGPGIDAAMLDPQWIAYVQTASAQAHRVFAICTGSLLLGAAGLLAGRRAGAHWQARDLLQHFGATVSPARLTRDGKFYTSGGVTSGIDLALQVVADLAGEERARCIQLALEYDPAPPFTGGTPATARPDILARVEAEGRARRASREARVLAAVAARLVPPPQQA